MSCINSSALGNIEYRRAEVYSANFPSSNVMITPRLDRNASMMLWNGFIVFHLLIIEELPSSVGKKIMSNC